MQLNVSAIEAFRKNQTVKTSLSSPQLRESEPDTPDDPNLNRRGSTPGDLRERSLAMYKSINNMLAFVKKPETTTFSKISVDEAKGFCLDHAVRCLQGAGPLTSEDSIEIYKVIESILSAGLEEFYAPASATQSPGNPGSPVVDRNNTPLNPQEIESSASKVKKTYLNTEKLKTLISTNLSSLIAKKGMESVPGEVEIREDNRVAAVAACTKGGRKVMEDQHLIFTHFNELIGLQGCSQSFYAVYDGHSGNGAAEYARMQLHLNLAASSNLHDNITEAFRETFLKTDNDFNYSQNSEALNSGTTACVVLVRENTLFIANVGDTEAVLSRAGNAILLSTKHTPDLPEEKERVQKAGGAVVWYGTWRVNGLLSVSRSIGDKSLNSVVIAEPSVRIEPCTEQDEFLIVATDGLWDLVKHEEACEMVRECIKNAPTQRKMMAQMLVDEAIKRKASDNVTVLVVFFQQQ